MNKSRATEVRNQHVLNMLFAIAESKNITVCENYRSGGVVKRPVFMFNPDKNDVQISGIRHIDDERRVSLTEMIELLEKYDVPDKLRLTSDYIAIVNRENKIVEVGCQKIPFDKVNELYELINKDTIFKFTKAPTKFIVGDKVKIIGNSNHHGYEMGSVYTIENKLHRHLNYDGDLFEIGPRGYIIKDCDIELFLTK
jgi:hypothetical protein